MKRPGVWTSSLLGTAAVCILCRALTSLFPVPGEFSGRSVLIACASLVSFAAGFLPFPLPGDRRLRRFLLLIPGVLLPFLSGWKLPLWTWIPAAFFFGILHRDILIAPALRNSFLRFPGRYGFSAMLCSVPLLLYSLLYPEPLLPPPLPGMDVLISSLLPDRSGLSVLVLRNGRPEAFREFRCLSHMMLRTDLTPRFPEDLPGALRWEQPLSRDLVFLRFRNPPGPAGMRFFRKDVLERIRTLLRPGGVFCVSIIGSDCPLPARWEPALKQVFPHVRLVAGYPLLLAASREPVPEITPEILSFRRRKFLLAFHWAPRHLFEDLFPLLSPEHCRREAFSRPPRLLSGILLLLLACGYLLIRYGFSSRPAAKQNFCALELGFFSGAGITLLLGSIFLRTGSLLLFPTGIGWILSMAGWAADPSRQHKIPGWTGALTAYLLIQFTGSIPLLLTAAALPGLSIGNLCRIAGRSPDTRYRKWIPVLFLLGMLLSAGLCIRLLPELF